MKWITNLSKTDKWVIKGFIIFIIFWAFMFFSSCIPLKKISDKTAETKQTELTEKTSEKTSDIQTNKEIKDDISIPIPESNDPEVTKELIELVKRMSSEKSSGDNSYKFWYDDQLKALRLRVEVAETKSKEVAVVEETIVEKTFEENINEYVKKIVIPWWVYALAVAFAWPYLKPIIMMILGPTNIIAGVTNFIKPKNDKLS